MARRRRVLEAAPPQRIRRPVKSMQRRGKIIGRRIFASGSVADPGQTTDARLKQQAD
jgi:hypothetical protein